MKIAIVTSEFVTETNFDGGLANYTHRLAKSLIKLGHKPVIFVKSEKDEVINFDGMEVYRIDIAKYDYWIYKTKYLRRVYYTLKRWIMKPWAFIKYLIGPLKLQSWVMNQRVKEINEIIKFDIIHYAHLGGVGYYRPSKVPAVARLSSSTALCQKYGGYGATEKEAIRQERLEFNTLKKMDNVFGPSRRIASVVGKEINRQIEIIETPYVEESEALDPTLYDNHLKGKTYLMFFGTIGHIKGCGTIAGIIYDVLEQHKDLYFVFVGKSLHSDDPSMNMFEYVKYKAKDYADRIIRFDKISHLQLYPVIQHSFCCVLPSRVDNFPNTCIEAMAHGKIVIGTWHNGFEQLIDNGESGFLIEVDDQVDLLKTINKIIALPTEEKQRIEKNAMKRVEMLKPEMVVAQLVELYKKTIDKFN